MTYWYCGVQVKDVNRIYSYISDLGELAAGTYVEVPFGQSNTLRIGIVKTCAEYTPDSAPFPVERCKHIIRVASPEEYEEQSPLPPFRFDAGDGEDIYEVDDSIWEEDWDEVLKWAIDHHTCTDEGIRQKVIECYRLCLQQGMPVAALNLGTFYYNGLGVAQDYAEAFRLYQIAAEAGELRAICNLGYCYYYGRDIPVDYGKAYHYFSTGALLFNDANCLYKLGDMYLNGYHVEENEKYAFLLYDRARGAVHEDEECLADIQFRMGKCLLWGIGVEPDIEHANAYLHLALLNFYQRRKTDPFVGNLIQSTKDLIEEAQTFLDLETI